jgi:TonB family protein
MMSWWHYLLLVNLYLMLFFAFYAVFLRRETFFQLNRVYLVAGALLSFLIPVVQSNWVRQLFITQKVHQTIYSAVDPTFIYQVKPVQNTPVTLGQIIGVIYVIGAVVLLLRLAYQLTALKKLMRRVGGLTPFSFFKTIVVDNSLPNQQTILAHEEVHSRQWHSADVLFIEAVMILNWFNPVVYLYRKAIKHVHEYIADRKAIQTGTSKAEYAMLLLSQTFGTQPHQLTNNFFNHSLLKQRIMMLNQADSRHRALLKYGLSAPLFMAMLVLSSATVNNSDIVRIINKKTELAFGINSIHLSKALRDSLIYGPDALNDSDVTVTATSVSTPAQKGTAESMMLTLTGNTEGKDSVSVTDHSPIFNVVEVNPTFPGGEESFSKFLRDNIRYPVQARDNHTQGRVFVQFVVEKDGSLSEMKTLRDPGDGLGDEALRVLSTSPKWLPGVQNGSQARVQYTVPVNFSLGDVIMGKKKSLDSVRILPPQGNLRLSTLPKKTLTVVVYKRFLADSIIKYPAGQHVMNIRVNGKYLSPEDLKKLKVQEIERMDVMDDFGTQKDTLAAKKQLFLIKMKDVKELKKD